MAIDPKGGLRPNAPVTGWEILSQIPGVGLGPDRKATQGITVTFISGKGVPGEVFIPTSQYTTLNVRAAVAAHAARLDEVQGMRG